MAVPVERRIAAVKVVKHLDVDEYVGRRECHE